MYARWGRSDGQLSGVNSCENRMVRFTVDERPQEQQTPDLTIKHWNKIKGRGLATGTWVASTDLRLSDGHQAELVQPLFRETTDYADWTGCVGRGAEEWQAERGRPPSDDGRLPDITRPSYHASGSLSAAKPRPRPPGLGATVGP